MVVTTSLVTAIVLGNPIDRAVLFMAWGVILFWIGLGGGLMYAYRETVTRWAGRIPWPRPLVFFFFSLILYFLEEVVTTSMTNTAPLFGVSSIDAHITASTNYFRVVFTSSLPVLGPLILLFTWMVFRFRFSATKTFFLFGLAGVFLETVNGGWNNILEAPFWIFIYGLMVWLPAYATTTRLDQLGKK